jgi:phospholipid/cholesterol/gamma-HCH transport system substrate-binding protein
MTDQFKTTLIGIFVVIACSLVVAIILFIEPSIGDGKQILNVRFSNINGISVGTRVMFAGKAIGEVTAIETIPDARNNQSDPSGEVYYYNLTLHVDSHVSIYNTDEFTVQTSGLLGDKSVSILPRIPEKNVIPSKVTTNSLIYAQSSDPLEIAFRIMSSLSEKIEVAVDDITTWFNHNSPLLTETISSFNDTMKQSSIAIKQINDTQLIEDIQITVQDFGQTANEINSNLAQMRTDKVFTNAGALVDNLKEASINVKQIMTNLSNGNGTIGKLLYDDEAYLQVSSILSKANTLFNDINQYGILFNMNKQWQRTRVKQAAMIDSLKSPQQFQNYFESEVDLINTSMGRLSLLIDKASNSQNRAQILNNPIFKSEFADLLQQVEGLVNTLKLYNEYLNDAAVSK